MSRISLLLLLLTVLGIGSLGASAYLLLQERDAIASSSSSKLRSESAETAAVATETAESMPAPDPTATAVSAPPEVPEALTISIQDGEEHLTLQTEATTVEDLLAEAEILLNEQDRVEPPPEKTLMEGMQVHIRRAIPLTIQVDGQSFAIFSSASKTAEVLANAGIAVGELDRTIPGPEEALTAGDIITIVRVREKILVEDEEVPFQTLYQPSEELDLDTKAIISNGVPGIKRRTTRVRYEDGVEVGREVEGEWMEQEPVNEVIGYGTRITTNMIDTPEGPREYWRVVHMRVTAYTAASSGKPPDHPSYGITASGLPAGTGIVAVDPNVIPFRSEVYVPGYGVGFAGDTGGGVKGRWIDLGYDEDELQTWNGYVDVYYLTPVPEEINYLLPEVLP